MKKMMFTAIVAIAAIISTTKPVAAQGGDKNIAFVPAKNHAAYVSFITQYNDADETASLTDKSAKEAKAALKATKANSKALKNFNAAYKGDAADASWSCPHPGNQPPTRSCPR